MLNKKIKLRVSVDVDVQYETPYDLEMAKKRIKENPPHKDVCSVGSGEKGKYYFTVKTTSRHVTVRSIRREK